MTLPFFFSFSKSYQVYYNSSLLLLWQITTNLVAWNNINLFFYSSGDWKFKISFNGLMSRYHEQSWLILRLWWENPFPCLFLAFSGHLHSWAHGPNFRAIHFSLCSCGHITFSVSWVILWFPSNKVGFLLIRPAVILSGPPRSGIISQLKITAAKVSEIRMGPYGGGGIIQPPTPCANGRLLQNCIMTCTSVKPTL